MSIKGLIQERPVQARRFEEHGGALSPPRCPGRRDVQAGGFERRFQRGFMSFAPLSSGVAFGSRQA